MRSCKSVRSVELEDASSLTPSSRRGRASKVLMPSRPGDAGGEVRLRPASEGEEPRATMALRLAESGAPGS